MNFLMFWSTRDQSFIDPFCDALARFATYEDAQEVAEDLVRLWRADGVPEADLAYCIHVVTP